MQRLFVVPDLLYAGFLSRMNGHDVLCAQGFVTTS